MKVSQMNDVLSNGLLSGSAINNPNPHVPEKVKWLPILVLLALFSASIVGSFAAKYSGNGGLSVRIQAAAFIAVLIPAAMRSRNSSLPVPSHYLITLILIVVYSTLLTYYQTAASSLSNVAESGMINKTLGLTLALLSIVLGVRIFRGSEVRVALFLFGIFEACFVLLSKYMGLGFNANNLGMRMAVAGLVLFGVTKPKLIFIRYGLLTGCLFFTFSLQCRTALVAALGAIAILFLEKHTKKQRAAAGFIAVFVLGSLFFLLPTIHSVAREIAVQSLGSSNPVAKFFLSDKNRAKIDTDYLDRQHVWKRIWPRIERRPIFGHGLGTEQELVGSRSHNAFLSLLFEGGVVLLFLWLSFYGPAAKSLLDRDGKASANRDSLEGICVLLLAYMFLAGLLESSGLASISSPVNVIFLFLILHQACEKEPSPRYLVANAP